MRIRNHSAELQLVSAAILAVGVTVVAIVLGMLAYSARSVDRLNRDNEAIFVSRALDRALDRLHTDIAAFTVWTEAYNEIQARDMKWLQKDFSDSFANDPYHGVLLLYDGWGNAFFAFKDNEPQDPSSHAALIAAIKPLIESVQKESAAKRFKSDGSRTASLEALATRESVVNVEGVLYLAAVSNIVTERPDEALMTDPDNLVAAARPIAPVIKTLQAELAIKAPRLAAPNFGGKPAVPIKGPAGESLGVLTWTPTNPGAGVLTQAAPLIAFALSILVIVSVLLLYRIKLILGSLASSRRELDASLLDLIQARDAAQAASLAKSRFLANMSHEIRTPLNGVLGMAQALTTSELSPEDQEKVRLILLSGQSLTAVLNDVLDLSKIEAGKFEISPTPSDIIAMLKQAVRLFAATAQEKGLSLVLNLPQTETPLLSFDSLRLQQCVSNLVSNAIKFTAEGEVAVGLNVADLGEGKHSMTISVRDTGIGMTAETISRLFDSFMQADATTTRLYGGTGLGLAISQRLCRLMGGDIDVVSEPDHGSTFTIRLAVEAAPRAEPAPSPIRAVEAPPARSVRGSRVLLVDDNALNRNVVKLFLAPLGVEFCEAVNGQEALEALSTESFDLVLLDVHMPVMDGRTCIARIRSSDAPWWDIPVIALTAEAMAGDRESLLAAGMSDYVAKPIDRAELTDKVVRILSGSPACSEADDHSPLSAARQGAAKR